MTVLQQARQREAGGLGAARQRERVDADLTRFGERSVVPKQQQLAQQDVA